MNHRGLYGQMEGNEIRSKTEQFEDLLHENWLVEGEWLKPMIAAAKRGNLKEIARLRDKMKLTYVMGGVDPELAQKRADSVMSQAMCKLRF